MSDKKTKRDAMLAERKRIRDLLLDHLIAHPNEQFGTHELCEIFNLKAASVASTLLFLKRQQIVSHICIRKQAKWCLFRYVTEEQQKQENDYFRMWMRNAVDRREYRLA